ncbi:hypothetical protein GDO86_011966 [Hymenochirus boettgeri]|uniref:DUF4806 domain-containing protein n=1 Tax=Hymenochirus boettgeri TaxID=247094 RepID=A0A8T2JLJ4_9PIPI|nr:hypothetical protein GDO86_011966 [Hymenochirus boettgeri]
MEINSVTAAGHREEDELECEDYLNPMESLTPPFTNEGFPEAEPEILQIKVEGDKLDYKDYRESASVPVTNGGVTNRQMMHFLSQVLVEIKEVKNAVLALRQEVGELRSNLGEQNRNQSDTPSQFPIRLPLDSKEDFFKAENALRNEVIYRRMVSRLTLVGGDNPDGTVRRMLKAVMTNRLACSFNWAGKGAKQSFKETRFQNCLFEALLHHFKESTLHSFSDAVKKWLRYAPEREGGAKRK